MNPDYNMYNPYFGVNEYNFRSGEMQDDKGEIITLNQAIGLIRKSIGNEKEDEMFYDALVKQAPTEKDKEIIRSIRDDERKHNQILRRLYFEFTGQTVPMDNAMMMDFGMLGMEDRRVNADEYKNKDYKENLEKALFGELDAVVKYRKILGTMPSGNSYTWIMSILTDELRHASKYNFLIHNAK